MAALLVASPAYAQEVTGALQGKLIDPDGKPVAYANIQATSPDLQARWRRLNAG